MANRCWLRKSVSVNLAVDKFINSSTLWGSAMIEKSFAEEFARSWIDAWNSHDLERILSHYSDQFEMFSPKIIQIAGEPSGTLKGKDAVGKYWTMALGLVPDSGSSSSPC